MVSLTVFDLYLCCGQTHFLSHFLRLLKLQVVNDQDNLYIFFLLQKRINKNIKKWNIEGREKENSSNHFGIITRNDLLVFFFFFSGLREATTSEIREKKPVGRNLMFEGELRNVLEKKKKTIFRLHQHTRPFIHRITHDAQNVFFTTFIFSRRVSEMET